MHLPSFDTIDGRVARLTFNRPDHGNAITVDPPRELAAAVGAEVGALCKRFPVYPQRLAGR